MIKTKDGQMVSEEDIDCMGAASAILLMGMQEALKDDPDLSEEILVHTQEINSAYLQVQHNLSPGDAEVLTSLLIVGYLKEIGFL